MIVLHDENFLVSSVLFSRLRLYWDMFIIHFFNSLSFRSIMKFAVRFCTVLTMFSIVLFLTNCGKKVDPPAIGELDTYEDRSMNFSIKFPKGWKAAIEPGKRAEYYSNEQIMNRFRSYDESEATGAKVVIIANKPEGPVTMDSIITASKIFEDPSVYAPVEDVTIDGTKGKLLKYAYKYGDGEFRGERYFAMKDSTAVTIIEFESFSGTFDAIRPKFDEMLKSVKLAYAKPIVRDTVSGKPAETFKPADALSTFEGKNFSMSYPTNFSGKPKGGGLESVQFQGIGGPSDCIMNVTVTDASKQNNLDRIIDQNKKLYKAESSSPAQVGGTAGAYIEDTPVKDVRRRTYFAVKGNKLYKVTLQWFKPEQEFFLPTFEKCFASLKVN
jgi:hypothetical protein